MLMEALADIPLPDLAQLEPVGRCMVSPKAPALMSFAAFSRLLAQFPNLRELRLQGAGEPLAHPRFLDMVRHAAARGVEVAARSRLPALSEKRAEQCVQSGLKRLEVTIDAANSGRALRHVERLVAAKARCGSLCPEIVLLVTATRSSLEQLPALVRFAHERGADDIVVQHLVYDFTATRRFVAAETLVGEDPARVEHAFEAARRAASECGVRLSLPLAAPAAMPGSVRCTRPWSGAYINFYGRAMPCAMAGSAARMGFGNMDREGVARIWNNDAYRAFRQRLAAGDPPEVCKGCAIYQGLVT
jgi:radical SAM protein with 4Fe4S-binding SPASM domain